MSYTVSAMSYTRPFTASMPGKRSPFTIYLAGPDTGPGYHANITPAVEAALETTAGTAVGVYGT